MSYTNSLKQYMREISLMWWEKILSFQKQWIFVFHRKKILCFQEKIFLSGRRQETDAHESKASKSRASQNKARKSKAGRRKASQRKLPRTPRTSPGKGPQNLGHTHQKGLGNLQHAAALRGTSSIPKKL